jgi:hypothetical protein
MLEQGLRLWLAPLAGFRPGGRPTFLSRDKKVGKEARPHCPRPLRFAAGQPALGALRGVPQNSLRADALRSNNCGKSDDEASLSFGRLATPHRAQRRRGQRGEGRGTGLRFARPRFMGAGS